MFNDYKVRNLHPILKDCYGRLSAVFSLSLSLLTHYRCFQKKLSLCRICTSPFIIQCERKCMGVCWILRHLCKRLYIKSTRELLGIRIWRISKETLHRIITTRKLGVFWPTVVEGYFLPQNFRVLTNLQPLNGKHFSWTALLGYFQWRASFKIVQQSTFWKSGIVNTRIEVV